MDTATTYPQPISEICKADNSGNQQAAADHGQQDRPDEGCVDQISVAAEVGVCWRADGKTMQEDEKKGVRPLLTRRYSYIYDLRKSTRVIRAVIHFIQCVSSSMKQA